MDEFDQAFEDSSNGTPPAGQPTSAPAVAPAPVVPPADEPAAAPALATPAAPAAATTEPQAPAPAPASDDADPAKLAQKVKTLQGILARQGDELAQSRRSFEELQQKLTTPAAPTPAAAPAAPTEEDALIAELEEASPTVAKAMRAILKKERAAMEQELEQRIGGKVNELTGQIAPLKEQAATQAVEHHFAAIEKAHPKWESVVASKEFLSWAQAQPAYVQRELSRVAKEGTATEVIEVLNSYRGNAKQPDTPPAGDPAEALRNQQKAALGTVPTRGAQVSTAGVNKNDFDAGFEAASAS